jgi:hypothetical protein
VESLMPCRSTVLPQDGLQLLPETHREIRHIRNWLPRRASTPTHTLLPTPLCALVPPGIPFPRSGGLSLTPHPFAGGGDGIGGFEVWAVWAL